jgi:hypothetical protein
MVDLAEEVKHKMATKRAKSEKKVKDLDPKGKSADVKGGRDILSRQQKKTVRKLVKRATNAADEIRG